MRRAVRVVVIAAVAVTSLPGAAHGGGSWIDPYEREYEAGAQVTMRGGVSVGQLGWVDDGPFHAYLRVAPDVGAGSDSWPFVAPTDVYLGELQLSGISKHSVFVTLTFSLPADLKAGTYDVVYCNDPCTEGLGDLIGGWVRVVLPVSGYATSIQQALGGDDKTTRRAVLALQLALGHRPDVGGPNASA